jgi:hypothetical protein
MGAVKVQLIDASSPARHRVALGILDPGDLADKPRADLMDIHRLLTPRAAQDNRTILTRPQSPT